MIFFLLAGFCLVFYRDSVLHSFDSYFRGVVQCVPKAFYELYGIEGVVLAGNGAGGYFVIQPNGKIFLYEYVGEDGEYYAPNISEYISKFYFPSKGEHE